MSNRKPVSFIIATKRNSSIKDILIAPNYPNCIVKVLEDSGMTNAILRSDGSLDQKFVLYFDQIYGNYPISCCKFGKLKPFGMFLGNFNGEIIIYEKSPHKSLLTESFNRIDSSVCTSKVVDILPHNQNNEILVLHSPGQHFHEFVNWKRQNSSNYVCSESFSVSEMKKFCPIYSEEGISKVVYLVGTGKIFISNISKGSNFENTLNQTLLTRVKNNSFPLESSNLLQISKSNWFIFAIGNRISIFCHENKRMTNSFSLPNSKEILIIREISSNSAVFDLFVYVKTTDSSTALLKLRIDPISNHMDITDLDLIHDAELLSIHVTPSYFILVTDEGIFVHDTLSLKRINKCGIPKFPLKYIHERRDSIKIEEFEENKFLFLWGNSLAQIWDFAPATKNQLGKLKLSRNSQIDQGLVGGKAIRKYSKYAIESEYTEWKEEKMEEDHLNLLRDRMNIEGLNEEELIAYATLISKPAESNQIDLGNISDDPDLQLALQLSLNDQ